MQLILMRDYDYIHYTRLEELFHPDQYVDLSQHHVTYVPYLHYRYSLQLQAKTFYMCLVVLFSYR